MERQVALNVHQHAPQLEDPITELRSRYAVISSIRERLQNISLAAVLSDNRADESVTLFPSISETSLQIAREERTPGFSRQYQIGLHINGGSKLSTRLVDAPTYSTTHGVSQIVPVQRLYGGSGYPMTFEDARQWLKIQNDGTSNIILLGDSQSTSSSLERLTDVQRYLFRLALNEVNMNGQIEIPAPVGSDFKDAVTKRVAHTFAAIAAQPTQEGKTRIIHTARSRSHVHSRSQSTAINEATRIYIRDYTVKQLQRVLTAAAVEEASIFAAAREAVKNLYDDPTIEQVMERINAQQNVDKLLQTIFA